MRKIKFRGKTIDERKWVYGSLVCNFTATFYIVDEQGEKYNIISKTAGQYAGLKDCNDEEIYEGDIIKSHILDNLFLVKYENGCFGAEYIPEEIIGYPLSILTNIEIIGNQYENPELLEEENNHG
ncbi:MAG: YopX family protein [Halanaerobiales bacterium]